MLLIAAVAPAAAAAAAAVAAADDDDDNGSEIGVQPVLYKSVIVLQKSSQISITAIFRSTRIHPAPNFIIKSHHHQIASYLVMIRSCIKPSTYRAQLSSPQRLPQHTGVYIHISGRLNYDNYVFIANCQSDLISPSPPHRAPRSHDRCRRHCMPIRPLELGWATSCGDLILFVPAREKNTARHARRTPKRMREHPHPPPQSRRAWL